MYVQKKINILLCILCHHSIRLMCVYYYHAQTIVLYLAACKGAHSSNKLYILVSDLAMLEI